MEMGSAGAAIHRIGVPHMECRQESDPFSGYGNHAQRIRGHPPPAVPAT